MNIPVTFHIWRAILVGKMAPVEKSRTTAHARLQQRMEGTAIMTNDSWIVLLGTVGGFCTTFAFVPQVIKIWKQGGRDLSYAMLSLYLVGVCLWLAYGLMIHAQAVIITNFATAILIAIATGLKAWTAKRD
jgi:MtN3 and saliva related transmembrane protein